MSALRRMLGCCRRDHVRNADTLKELALEKDNVEVLTTIRRSYFGHVARMNPDRYLHMLLDGHIRGICPRGKDWKTTSLMTVKHYVTLSLSEAEKDLQRAEPSGEACRLEPRNWLCRSEWIRQRRRGIKSSQVKGR